MPDIRDVFVRPSHRLQIRHKIAQVLWQGTLRGVPQPFGRENARFFLFFLDKQFPTALLRNRSIGCAKRLG